MRSGNGIAKIGSHGWGYATTRLRRFCSTPEGLLGSRQHRLPVRRGRAAITTRCRRSGMRGSMECRCVVYERSVVSGNEPPRYRSCSVGQAASAMAPSGAVPIGSTSDRAVERMPRTMADRKPRSSASLSSHIVTSPIVEGIVCVRGVG